MCVRGNACRKHPCRQTGSQLREGDAVESREQCGVGTVIPKWLWNVQASGTPVKVKPFTKLPPKAGWQPTRLLAGFLLLIQSLVLLHKDNLHSANQGTTEVHIVGFFLSQDDYGLRYPGKFQMKSW